MKNIQKSSIIKWPWVSAVIMVFIIAFAAGCANAETATPEDDLEWHYQALEFDAEAERGSGSSNEHECDDDCHHEQFSDFDMIVATVNGININAGEVMMEFGSWPINMLVMEYMEMFPDDVEFDFDRIFRDGANFGRVVLEEATRMAAHVKLFYGYAIEHDIEWAEMGFQHPVVYVVEAIINDPDKFAQFEAYMQDSPDMPEEVLAYIEKAEAILERAQQGEDFRELIETYGEDPGMTDFPEGYTFVRGDMVPPFENATIELEIGEISGLVISTHGIHIIKRIEPDPDNIFPGSSAPPDVDEEDLLGAIHILIRTSVPIPTQESMMFDAVFDGFETMLIEADIQFLAALYDIPLG
ncbi:MAG: peptidyl-prolyl cis-trans isomerase [Defluviitaleaceae bacterium]|nr:peptidyl-prolyl cis-trans isomerase [Defluviitaleaceae bacterium]